MNKILCPSRTGATRQNVQRSETVELEREQGSNAVDDIDTLLAVEIDFYRASSKLLIFKNCLTARSARSDRIFREFPVRACGDGKLFKPSFRIFGIVVRSAHVLVGKAAFS